MKDSERVLEIIRSSIIGAVKDNETADKIFKDVKAEMAKLSRIYEINKYLENRTLQDLETDTVATVREEVKSICGETATIEVSVISDDEPHVLVTATDVDFSASGTLYVAEPKIKFVPFLVALPTDTELTWILAKQETLSNLEAEAILNRIADEFWSSKTGQKALKDRVEKTFAEFIDRVNSSALKERGLKRIFKQPEPVKILKPVIEV